MISKISSLNEFNILVTGACGFLGRRLVKALLDNGAYVVGIDSKPLTNSFAEILENDSFSFVYGSFFEKSQEALSQLMLKGKKPAMFHLAGLARAGECEENPVKAFESNSLLTFQVLDFCRRNNIRKFLFPSTGLVYGDHLKRLVTEEDPTFSQNIYVATKLSAEAMIQGYAESFDMTCIIARLGNVYGADSSSDTVLGTIVSQIKDGKNIAVHDLTPVRDFIYIDDVIEGLLRLFIIINNMGCHVVNLSTGVGVSVQNLIETVCKITSIPTERIHLNESLNRSTSTLILDNRLFVEKTRWKPKHTLSEGLSLMLRELDMIGFLPTTHKSDR